MILSLVGTGTGTTTPVGCSLEASSVELSDLRPLCDVIVLCVTALSSIKSWGRIDTNTTSGTAHHSSLKAGGDDVPARAAVDGSCTRSSYGTGIPICGGWTARRDVNRKSGVNAASLAVACWSMMAGVSQRNVMWPPDARGDTVDDDSLPFVLMTFSQVSVFYAKR